jgi:very-short-patch-repair endonuclease
MRSDAFTLLKKRARRLRQQQTDAEGKLWMRLRARQLCDAKFRRQHPIGSYIADFCCVERGLIVELDGSQHAVQAKRDQRRSNFLNARGYRVLRFWDNDVLQNIDAVLERITPMLNDPHPGPLPDRARVKKKTGERTKYGN